MNYWLVKTEPESYSWTDFLRDGKTAWTGIRNYQARNNLRAMQRGDVVLFYHSVSDKQIVGLAKVVKTAYPDSTADEEGWLCVDLAPDRTLPRPVPLAEIKADTQLKDMALLRNSRLSVTPVTKDQYKRLLQLAGEKK
jgi:predicted RNA-binding protein with PUA-like domain